MNKKTKEQDNLLNQWLNDWWFKEGVLSYNELAVVKNIYHNSDEYSKEDQIVLTEVRTKWIDYTQNDKYTDGMPEFLKKMKNFKKKIICEIEKELIKSFKKQINKK